MSRSPSTHQHHDDAPALLKAVNEMRADLLKLNLRELNSPASLEVTRRFNKLWGRFQVMHTGNPLMKVATLWATEERLLPTNAELLQSVETVKRYTEQHIAIADPTIPKPLTKEEIEELDNKLFTMASRLKEELDEELKKDLPWEDLVDALKTREKVNKTLRSLQRRTSKR